MTPRKPGARKKYGGRKKGTPNKTSLGVAEKLAKMGCDPILGMAKLAETCEKELEILDIAIKNTDDIAEKSRNIACKQQHLTMAGSMYKELAQYVAPKRKAIEHTGENGNTIVITQIERIIVKAKN